MLGSGEMLLQSKLWVLFNGRETVFNLVTIIIIIITDKMLRLKGGKMRVFHIIEYILKYLQLLFFKTEFITLVSLWKCWGEEWDLAPLYIPFNMENIQKAFAEMTSMLFYIGVNVYVKS